MALEPLAEFPAADRRAVVAVLADIDDTLTHEGRLEAVAYTALERLRAAGLLVIPVTGRPAGWCDLIARQWPVDAVVGENGTFWFRHDPKAGKLVKRFVIGDAERTARAQKLDAIAQRILTEVPGCAISADQPYRMADLAIDFCEDVPPLPRQSVAQIVSIMEAEGLTAKVSSIHVNGWFGEHDKWSGACWAVEMLFGRDLLGEVERWVYVGDSTNDQVMFERFALSVGVANLRRFANELVHWPAWITEGERGEGFAELGRALLQARAEGPVGI